MAAFSDCKACRRSVPLCFLRFLRTEQSGTLRLRKLFRRQKQLLLGFISLRWSKIEDEDEFKYGYRTEICDLAIDLRRKSWERSCVAPEDH